MRAIWNRCRRRAEGGSERGMALVFTLLGLLLLSALAASLMFVTSAGSFASMSFKSQMQASFAANTGVQAALDWFRTYYAPNWLDNATGIATTRTAYLLTVQPPTYGGNAVTLGGSANFPSSDVVSSFAAFSTSPNNQITMENTTGSYTMTASLMAHDRYKKMDNTDVISERWMVNVTGTVAGPLGNSTVRETAVIERVYLPLFNDAIRGKCDVSLGGNIGTDSYFSASGSYGGSNKFTGSDAQASVGSNALIQASGASATINGNAYWGSASGACTGGEAIAHDTIVLGKIIEAPGVPFPPILPDFSDTTGASTNDCTASPIVLRYNTTNLSAYNQNSSSAPPTGHYRKCSVNSKDVYLCVPARSGTTAAYFFFNTMDTGGNATLFLVKETSPGVCPASPAAGDYCSDTNQCMPSRVYVNQALTLNGNGGIMGAVDPRYMSFFYSGTDPAVYTGNSDFYATVYAPFATVQIKGTAGLYGSITALNVDDQGTGDVHYDLSLQNMWGTASPFRIINQTRDVF